jgi:hypothetical protein
MDTQTVAKSTIINELDTSHSKSEIGSSLNCPCKRRRGSVFYPILMPAYMITIPAANFLIGHVGTVCVPDGPCLIPVAPGVLAPSGVLMIGAALLLRDLVQRRYGARWSLGCIAAGTSLSFLIAPAALALDERFHETDQIRLPIFPQKPRSSRA